METSLDTMRDRTRGPDANASPTVQAGSLHTQLAHLHTLPAWFLRLQRHVFMPVLIGVTGSLMAQMLMHGFAFSSWLDTPSALLAAGFGMLCGGMTVLCSVGMVVQWRLGYRLVACGLFSAANCARRSR